MVGFILRRIAGTLPVILVVSVLVFLLIQLTPGDPAVQAAGGPDARPEDIVAARERLGLSDPLPVRYVNWVSAAAVGDLGTSLFSSRKVSAEIISRLPATLTLTASALALGILVAVPAGTYAALRRGSIGDKVVSTMSGIGVATPSFVAALLLIKYLALDNRLLPSSGYVSMSESLVGWARYMLLPAVSLAMLAAAELTRHVRASVSAVLQEDYIRTARAKGLAHRKIVGKHTFKNAAIPVVTVLGAQVRRLLGGTIVIELIFNQPGIGRLVIDAVFSRDYPMVQGVAVGIVFVVLIINLLVDMTYAYFDPRVRVS